MKTYLVGGAVRDMVMGVEPRDMDYVIVGATQADVERMLKEGYEQVGMSFPVFLGPDMNEYALARVERKTGVGYNGFSVHTENVTLEQDLSRRDLTMNSMAFDVETKELIDPFGGREDIASLTMRHTSEAFAEDPMRVLRVARFLARYPGFKVADETTELCKRLVDKGELNSLSDERFFLEMVKALVERSPERFFTFLRDVGALDAPCFLSETFDFAHAGAVEALLKRLTMLSARDKLTTLLMAFGRRTVNKVLTSESLLFAQLFRQLTQHGSEERDAERMLKVLSQLTRGGREKLDHFVALSERILCVGQPGASSLTTLSVAAWHVMQVRASQLPHLQGKALGEALHQRKLDIITALHKM